MAFIDFDDAHPGSRLDDLVAAFFRSYGLNGALAIDSIVAAQTALSARLDSPGVREWASNCRAWVAQNRETLAVAIAAGDAR